MLAELGHSVGPNGPVYIQVMMTTAQDNITKQILTLPATLNRLLGSSLFNKDK